MCNIYYSDDKIFRQEKMELRGDFFKMNKNLKQYLEKIKEPRFVHKSLAVFLTVLSIAVIVGINILIKFLDNKYSLSYDLTSNKIFSITEDSINYLGELDKEVEIIVLSDKDNFISNGDYFRQADNVINEYAKYSDKISIRYVNLDENPMFKASYPNEELDSDNIIVKSGEKYKILSAYDIFNVQQSYGGLTITSSKAEQSMTSAIIYVTSNEQIKVNVLTGFDELDSSSFQKLLKDNNYNVESKSMLTDNIDSEAEFAVIYSPKRDYDEQAIEKVKNYLYNDGKYGKNLIYFLYPSQTGLSKLDALLKEWGIKVGDGLVYDADVSKLFLSSNIFNTLTEYEEDEYSQGINNKSIPVAMPLSKPIEILDKDKVQTLLKFSSTSGIKPSNADQNWTPDKDSLKGDIPAMVLSKSSDSEEKSTLIVVSSAASADSGLLSRSSLNNSLYFLNIFNTITKREDYVNIESKAIGVSELGMNGFQAIVYGILFALGIPILVLLIGITIWLLKRKK